MRSLLLLPLFLLSCYLVDAQNYEPIWSGSQSLYKPKLPGGDVIPDNFVRMAFDSAKTVGAQISYFPYRTVAKYNSNYNVAVRTHCWLGKEIILNKPEGWFTIKNDNYRFDPDQYKVVKEGEGSFRIYYDRPVGYQWSMGEFGEIVAEVVGIESFFYEGEKDMLKTIRLTNENDAYSWAEGEIKISENHGIISLPNMQFFPYEWITYEFYSSNLPGSKLVDPDPYSMFHMNEGDKYTTHFQYSNPPNDFGQEYTQYECLKINSLNGNIVDRDMHITTIRYDRQTGKWEVEEETINEVVDYDGFYVSGAVDRLTDVHGQLFYTYLIESGTKYGRLMFETEDWIEEVVDVCSSYSFASAFDQYYDCDYGINGRFKVPIFIEKDGEIWGHDIDVDSLLNVTPVDWSADVVISPNPNDGVFTVDLPDNIDLKTVFAVDIFGRSCVIIRQGSQLKADVGQGLYALIGITESGQRFGLGKLIVIK